MLVLIFAFFFGSSDSSTPVVVEGPPISSKELATYMSSFVKHAHGAIKLKDLADSEYMFAKLAWSTEPDDDRPRAIADCTSNFHSAPFKIRLDPKYWKTIGYEDKWAILFHEWGHCACGLEHTTEKGEEWLAGVLAKTGAHILHARRLPDGCPDSLMNWRIPNKVCIVVHRDEYITELFNKCKRPTRLASRIPIE